MVKNNIPYNVLRNPNDWENAPRGPLATAIGGALGFSTTTLFGGSAISLFGGALVISTASVVGSLVLYAVTSWAQKALTPKLDQGSFGSEGLLVNNRNATGPQQFVYGEIRKGGQITYYEATGDNNRYLHQIIVLAGHEINSIEQIYLNDEVATIDSNGFCTDDKWASKVRIYYHLGDQTSVTDDFANVSGKNLNNTLLTESELTGDDALDSNFVGKGLAYIYVRYDYDRDVFANGIPTITAKIKGKKVYDPREAGQSYSTPSTWTFSDNAALCIRDFIASEYGLADTSIDDVSFQAAANECDESVTTTNGSENRYTLSGVIDASRAVGDVLEDMVTSCAGTLFYGAGNWMLKAGAYTSPVKTFTDDDFRSGINLDTKISMRDNFNTIQGTYISAEQDYISTDYPQVSSSTYLTEDNNEESILDLPLPFTTSSTMAQRLAKLTLLRGRQQMVFNATFGTEAMEVEVGDIVRITHARYSWTNKEFEVLGWKLDVSESGGLVVQMNLRETSSSAFAWNTQDETPITNPSTIVPDPTDVASIGAITASNTGFIDGDGRFQSRITLNWADVVGAGFSHYEVQHKLSTDSQYESFETPVSIASFTQYKKDDVVNYRIRAVNENGRTGTFTSVGSITVTGDTTAPAVPTSLSASGAFRAISLEWTNPSDVDFSHAEVWRSATNNSSQASKIAETSADYYVDAPLAGNTTFYYWVKAADFSGNVSAFSTGANAQTSLIEGDDIPSGTITETMISDDSISTAKIKANAISANELAADSVTAGKIQAGAVNAAKIAADAIDANKISVNTLSAISANMGTLTAGNIQLGNLAVNTTNMKPTSGVGIRLESDGDIAIGSDEKYFRFDASAGEMEIRGEIINFKDTFFVGNEGNWTSVNNSQNDLGSQLSGAGVYAFLLVGSGGSGGSGYASQYNIGSAGGGGGGGCVAFGYEWDGSTALALTIGSVATNGNTYTNTSNNSRSGTTSLSIGGTTRISITGGALGYGGGNNNNNNATGGGGGVPTVNGNFIQLKTATGGAGGTGSGAAGYSYLPSGGGGVDAGFSVDISGSNANRPDGEGGGNNGNGKGGCIFGPSGRASTAQNVIPQAAPYWGQNTLNLEYDGSSSIGNSNSAAGFFAGGSGGIGGFYGGGGGGNQGQSAQSDNQSFVRQGFAGQKGTLLWYKL